MIKIFFIIIYFGLIYNFNKDSSLNGREIGFLLSELNVKVEMQNMVNYQEFY